MHNSTTSSECIYFCTFFFSRRLVGAAADAAALIRCVVAVYFSFCCLVFHLYVIISSEFWPVRTQTMCKTGSRNSYFVAMAGWNACWLSFYCLFSCSLWISALLSLFCFTSKFIGFFMVFEKTASNFKHLNEFFIQVKCIHGGYTNGPSNKQKQKRYRSFFPFDFNPKGDFMYSVCTIQLFKNSTGFSALRSYSICLAFNWW